MAFNSFAGTEDAQVLEIEVKAYRRVIHRHRYTPSCQCGCASGIVSAAAPARLINRGKFGISVWTSVLLDKFLYGRPSQRLLQDLADHGLNMSPGTLAGGLQAIAPLFKPLDAALQSKLRSEPYWHADETRWAVFVNIAGKVGHRWYLWVFHSSSVVHYVIDRTRAADVISVELAGVDQGVISCDRYSGYKRFARLKTKTNPVAQKKPNAFWLYDMHGNVWEWTQDCGNADYTGAPSDGSAWATGDCSSQVNRGGSWVNASPRSTGRNRGPRAGEAATLVFALPEACRLVVDEVRAVHRCIVADNGRSLSLHLVAQPTMAAGPCVAAGRSLPNSPTSLPTSSKRKNYAMFPVAWFSL